MTKSRASLLLFTLAGCFHTSPDAAVLAPLVAHLTEEPFGQSNQPEYLVFADELSATVFKSLSQDTRYRIVLRGKPFVCPSDIAQCRRSELRVRVEELMGDSAIATMERIYSNPDGHPTAYREQILLVRRNRKWRIGKVLGGSAMAM